MNGAVEVAAALAPLLSIGLALAGFRLRQLARKHWALLRECAELRRDQRLSKAELARARADLSALRMRLDQTNVAQMQPRKRPRVIGGGVNHGA